jgi:glycosyltransferase involved in cell wall biosynthesis
MNISVIIATYDESGVIQQCITSLLAQTRRFELLLVDDGSTDNTFGVIDELIHTHNSIIVLKQNHLGPAAARNLGAQKASGEILVFVDADMTFHKDFLEQLVQPIEADLSRGTFTKDEYVLNWNNIWARCWNYNQGIANNRRIPADYPDKAPVFRAILASEFKRIGGYTVGVGWTDDWTLSRKLGYHSTSTHAVCYHANPGTLYEVYKQARWIGKNEFLAGNWFRFFISVFRFSFPASILLGILGTITYKTPEFLLFKLWYDFAVSVSLLESRVSRNLNK